MAGITNLEVAVPLSLSANQRRVVRAYGSFGKHTIGAFDQFADAQARADQTAENRVQAIHQQGRGDPFSRNVPDHEVQIASLRRDQIAVVTAHWPGGLIVISDFPSVEFEVLFRQRLTLDQPCAIEIL